MRAEMLKGVNVLADAVAVTMGPKVLSIIDYIPTYPRIFYFVITSNEEGPARGRKIAHSMKQTRV